MIDESTFESRLTKMTMAQIASEWAVVRTYIVPDRPSIIEEAEVIFTRAVRLQTFLTQQFEEDNYGPRHNLRKQFANLLVWVRVTEPGTSRIIEKAKALQTQANDCGDRGMHHILKSLRLCTILESQETVILPGHFLDERRSEGSRPSGHVKMPGGGPKRGSRRDVWPRSRSYQTNEDIVGLQTFRQKATTPFLKRL